MELAPAVGTIVAPPDGDAPPRGSRRLQGAIVVTAKVTIAFVIGTIALPALIMSALIASAVVFAIGAAHLVKQVLRFSDK